LASTKWAAPCVKLEISERHRHRYEFNCEYDETLARAGFRVTGRTPDGVYVEIIEVSDHPWFVGCQFHPEFKSKPLAPHPLFSSFVRASLAHRRDRAALPAEIRTRTADPVSD
jgi:CTP synthase